MNLCKDHDRALNNTMWWIIAVIASACTAIIFLIAKSLPMAFYFSIATLGVLYPLQQSWRDTESVLDCPDCMGSGDESSR